MLDNTTGTGMSHSTARGSLILYWSPVSNGTLPGPTLFSSASVRISLELWTIPPPHDNWMIPQQPINLMNPWLNSLCEVGSTCLKVFARYWFLVVRIPRLKQVRDRVRRQHSVSYHPLPRRPKGDLMIATGGLLDEE